MRLEDYRERIDELLEQYTNDPFGQLHALYMGTLTIAEALYGRASPAVREIARYEPPLLGNLVKLKRFQRALIGALTAMKGDLDGGLIPSPQLKGAGRVLEDMVSLSREALSRSREVAAVLAAVAFEDTIRRLGEVHLEESSEQKLAEIIRALAEASVLTASEKRIALDLLIQK